MKTYLQWNLTLRYNYKLYKHVGHHPASGTTAVQLAQACVVALQGDQPPRDGAGPPLPQREPQLRQASWGLRVRVWLRALPVPTAHEEPAVNTD